MAVNPTVAKHLTEARRELVEQRDALDRDIAELDRMLQGYPRSATVTVTEDRGLSDNVVIEVGSAPPAPPMKESIVALLNSQDREFATKEVVAVVSGKYGWQPSSVRSLLGKLAMKGDEVQAVRRGVYRAALAAGVPDAPQNPSGPASAGPEVQVTTSGTGGGGSDAEPDQDHGNHLPRREDRDDRGGAPVGGFTL